MPQASTPPRSPRPVAPAYATLARLRTPLVRRAAVVLGATVYASVASLGATRGVGLAPWASSGAAIVLASLSLRANADRRRRRGFFGLALVLAAAHAPGWVGAFGALGAWLTIDVALRAIASIESPPSLLSARARGPRWFLAIAAIAWIFAGASEIGGTGWAPLDALSSRADLLVAIVAIGSSCLIAGFAAERAIKSRLELAVPTRAWGAVLASLFACGFSAVWYALRDATFPSALVLGCAAGSIAAAEVASYADAVAVARSARRLAALTAFAGPVIVIGALAAQATHWDSGVVLLVTSSLAVLVALAVRYLEEPFAPEGGAWLAAAAKCCAVLQRHDASEALREALLALRAAAGPNAPSPALYSLVPPRARTVDAAGYLREREGAIPLAIADIARDEPEATLRGDVLRALEVRRADLRPLLAWMDDHGAALATLVACDGQPEGVLVLPRGVRRRPFTLEEVRAVKDVADRLASALATEAALARGLVRERALSANLDRAEEEIARRTHYAALDAGRNQLVAARLARPATVGVYSALSRMAFEAIERRASVGAPTAVVAPTGVDPIPYLARAHLSGVRKDGAFVTVDGTSAREHDEARWRDPLASPLALADRGVLVLLDGAALPLEIQRVIARALAERHAPWERTEPLDITLAFTATESPSALLDAGRLDAALALRLGDAIDAPIALPRVCDRPEDLRAVLTDRLAREGMRTRGEPVGMDDAAFARLVEHPFLGEDAELALVVQRLVARVNGNIIRAGDVETLALERPGEGPAGLRLVLPNG